MKIMVPIFAFFVGVVLLQPRVRADFFSDPDPLPAFAIDVDVSYADVNVSVDNMPLSIRNVPIHPDDLSYVPPGNQGPINRLKYSVRSGIDWTIMGAYEFAISDKPAPRFNIGVGVDLLFASSGDMAERNYTNAVGTDERGTGAALTYARLFEGNVAGDPNGQDSLVNVAPIVKFEVAPFPDEPFRNLWFGTSVSYFTISAQNGWDRYDSFQALSTDTLSTVVPIRAYGTYFLGGGERFGLTAGVKFNQSFETSVGKEAGTSVTPLTFFFGVSMRL